MDRLGGENPRRNENIALEPRFFLCCLLFGSPFREGKVTCVYPLFSKPRARSHTHKQTPAITSISMTSQWPTPLRFKSSSCWRMTDMCLCECVCESEQSSVMKIFNFKMATDDFSQLVCLGFSSDGNTFHDGDAFGKYGSLALLIARLEKVLHLPRSIVCSLLAKN